MTPAYREVLESYRAVDPLTQRTCANPTEAHAVANLVQRWLETHTPTFMDDAVDYCQMKDLPVLPSLRKHLADAARMRRKSDSSKAMREGMKDAAFNMIANLLFHDATLREACGKVAKAFGNQWKASSLEHDYPTAYRSGERPIENILHDAWRNDPDPELTRQWQAIRAALPEPSDEERGERR